MLIPFTGPTYNSRSINIDCQRSINFYPEIELADSKAIMTLIGTPGTSVFTTVAGVVRGGRVFNNLLYVVVADHLYSITSAGVVSAALGTLNTNSGRVDIKDNGLASLGVGGNQLIIVDGGDGYIYNVVTGTFSVIASPGFPANASSVAYMDGYFIVTDPSSMSYNVSNLYDGLVWNALATSPVQATPDTISKVYNLHNQLWFIKKLSSEVWYNAGISTTVGSPFNRMTGAIIDYGTEAPWSVASGDNSLFWVATQKHNDSYQFVGVVELNGYTPIQIAPPPIIYQMNQWTRYDDVTGYCYSEGGHTFYVVTSPSSNQTFVYDVTTKLWHERSRYVDNPYTIGRHHSDHYFHFNGKHYISEYDSGNIMEMSSAYYKDGTDPLVSIRQAQHLFEKDGMLRNVFYRKLVIDMEMGVGDAVTLDPKAILSWSDDSGRTWSSDYECTMGKIGEFGMKASWKSLGYSTNRVFRLMISDPVKRIILGAYAS